MTERELQLAGGAIWAVGIVYVVLLRHSPDVTQRVVAQFQNQLSWLTSSTPEVF